jgi:murein DD-endopeptidase MepM/ murein hydrolase activator NlpD
MLPDDGACVHLPDEDDDPSEPAPEAESRANAHFDRGGRWVVYDEVPRRPDRPADYGAYRYPIPCENCMVSGYDLDRPDALQRRGRRLKQVGHGAVDLLARRGTPIDLVTLEHQHGDAEVLYVGPLFGTTVVTRHSLREGGQLHDYILVFGHLDAPAVGVQRGSTLKEGDLVGFVGDSGSPSLVHLHLEARRVRDGIDASRLTPAALVDGSGTIVCDPRNVLPELAP